MPILTLRVKRLVAITTILINAILEALLTVRVRILRSTPPSIPILIIFLKGDFKAMSK